MFDVRHIALIVILPIPRIPASEVVSSEISTENDVIGVGRQERVRGPRTASLKHTRAVSLSPVFANMKGNIYGQVGERRRYSDITRSRDNT